MSTSALLAKLRPLAGREEYIGSIEVDTLIAALESVDRLTRERDEAREWARELAGEVRALALDGDEDSIGMCQEFDALPWAHGDMTNNGG